MHPTTQINWLQRNPQWLFKNVMFVMNCLSQYWSHYFHGISLHIVAYTVEPLKSLLSWNKLAHSCLYSRTSLIQPVPDRSDTVTYRGLLAWRGPSYRGSTVLAISALVKRTIIKTSCRSHCFFIQVILRKQTDSDSIAWPKPVMDCCLRTLRKQETSAVHNIHSWKLVKALIWCLNRRFDTSGNST